MLQSKLNNAVFLCNFDCLGEASGMSIWRYTETINTKSGLAQVQLPNAGGAKEFELCRRILDPFRKD